MYKLFSSCRHPIECTHRPPRHDKIGESFFNYWLGAKIGRVRELRYIIGRGRHVNLDSPHRHNPAWRYVLSIVLVPDNPEIIPEASFSRSFILFDWCDYTILVFHCAIPANLFH